MSRLDLNAGSKVRCVATDVPAFDNLRYRFIRGEFGLVKHMPLQGKAARSVVRRVKNYRVRDN